LITAALVLATQLPATAATVTGTAGNDVLLGTNNADTISAGDGIDVVFARGGNDKGTLGNDGGTFFGGGGGDVFSATTGPNVWFDDDGRARRKKADRLGPSPGSDTFYAIDGAKDYVACGDGDDIGFVDTIDVTDGLCETVVTPTSGTLGVWSGTNKPDSVAFNGNETRVVFGLGGADGITGSDTGIDLIMAGRGADVVRARGGADVLVDDDGVKGDALDAGADNDTIYAADGARTVVTCGTGSDTAYVDSIDAVSGDCEIVES
jgi:Ca2+-binding RTX toxin-like protein